MGFRGNGQQERRVATGPAVAASLGEGNNGPSIPWSGTVGERARGADGSALRLALTREDSEAESKGDTPLTEEVYPNCCQGAQVGR